MPIRNPRRAYNKDGSMVQPATVGSERRFGHKRAEIWCNDCLHHAEISMEGLPDDLPIPDICLRYRCSKCGGKNLMSRGSIDEHYELIEQQRTGKDKRHLAPARDSQVRVEPGSRSPLAATPNSPPSLTARKS